MHLPTPELKVWDLGLEAYGVTYARQRERVDEMRQDPDLSDGLFLVEHPDVYTSGRKSALGEAGPARVVTQRGGEDTFHNPGQLVAYPILRLREGERDVHRYLRAIEGALIDLLATLGIRAVRREGATGVWVEGGTKKIASIGVALTGWVTYHGLALNVSNDLRGFQKIHPCGFSGDVMTSVAEQIGGQTPPIAEIKTRLVAHLCQHFSRVSAS